MLPMVILCWPLFSVVLPSYCHLVSTFAASSSVPGKVQHEIEDKKNRTNKCVHGMKGIKEKRSAAHNKEMVTILTLTATFLFVFLFHQIQANLSCIFNFPRKYLQKTISFLCISLYLSLSVPIPHGIWPGESATWIRLISSVQVLRKRGTRKKNSYHVAAWRNARMSFWSWKQQKMLSNMFGTHTQTWGATARRRGHNKKFPYFFFLSSFLMCR